MDLMAQATQEYDGGRGLFMPDWEVLQWTDVVKMRDARAHANRKEDICLAIAHPRTGVTSSTPYLPLTMPNKTLWRMMLWGHKLGVMLMMMMAYRPNFPYPPYFALL